MKLDECFEPVHQTAVFNDQMLRYTLRDYEDNREVVIDFLREKPKFYCSKSAPGVSESNINTFPIDNVTVKVLNMEALLNMKLKAIQNIRHGPIVTKYEADCIFLYKNLMVIRKIYLLLCTRRIEILCIQYYINLCNSHIKIPYHIIKCY